MYLNLDNINTLNEIENMINNLSVESYTSSQRDIFYTIFTIKDLNDRIKKIYLSSIRYEEIKRDLETMFPDLVNLFNNVKDVFEDLYNKEDFSSHLRIKIFQYFYETHSLFNYNLWEKDFNDTYSSILSYWQENEKTKTLQKIEEQLKQKFNYMDNFYKENPDYEGVSELFSLLNSEASKNFLIDNAIEKYFQRYQNLLSKYKQTKDKVFIHQIENELFNEIETTTHPSYKSMLEGFDILKKELPKNIFDLVVQAIKHWSVYFLVSKLLRITLNEEDEETVVYFHQDPMIEVN